MTYVHVLYLIFTLLIFITIIRKRDITILCAFSVFAVSFAYTHSISKTLGAVCKLLQLGFTDMLSVFVGIAMMISMTEALKASGSGTLVKEKLSKFPRNKYLIFLMTGALMFIISMFIWPSPAVVLIGSLIIPLSKKTGLAPVYLASAINLFGHGMALSGDFFIQGVPAIAVSSGQFESSDIMPYLIPLWAVMAITVVIVSLFGLKKAKIKVPEKTEKCAVASIRGKASKKMLACVLSCILLLIGAVVIIFICGLTGDDATNVISGTALLVTCVICFIDSGRKNAAENAAKYITKSFTFTMKVFVPALLVIAFFALGNAETASVVLGDDAPGFLSDTVSKIVSCTNVPEFALSPVMAFISIIYSVDGSGFAGLMVIGNIANSLAASAEHIKILTALGQIVIIWVAGGTLIPWSVIPVSSVTGVKPTELVKRNLVPVAAGLVACVACASVMLVIL